MTPPMRLCTMGHPEFSGVVELNVDRRDRVTLYSKSRCSNAPNAIECSSTTGMLAVYASALDTRGAVALATEPWPWPEHMR